MYLFTVESLSGLKEVWITVLHESTRRDSLNEINPVRLATKRVSVVVFHTIQQHCTLSFLDLVISSAPMGSQRNTDVLAPVSNGLLNLLAVIRIRSGCHGC